MPISLSRRQFLVGTAAAAAAAAAAALGDGFLIEPVSIDVTRHDVPIPGLAHELDGFRIACITDVHLHRGIHRAARATLKLLARERPHLVALTGDICNRRRDLEDLVAFAGQARGTVATVATLGNWEHDAGIDRATGEKAHGLDEREPCLWVVHAPGYVDTIQPGVVPPPAAVLSGHAHGGQVRLPFYTPYTPYGSGRFVAGWYRDTLAPLYVSRGIGTVLLPARLFCPPELPIFTLRKVDRTA